MKKYMIIATTAVLLSGCFNKADESKEKNEIQLPKNEQTAENNEDKDPSTKREESNKEEIQISIPMEQYEELSKEEITEVLKEEGAENIQFTKENKIIYNVPKKQFNEQKEKLQNELKAMIASINENKQYPSIQKVEASKDYTNYQLIVERNKYENSFDSLAVLSLVTSTLYYFSYIGNTEATIMVDYIDMEAKEPYKTLKYPEQVQQ